MPRRRVGSWCLSVCSADKNVCSGDARPEAGGLTGRAIPSITEGRRKCGAYTEGWLTRRCWPSSLGDSTEERGVTNRAGRRTEVLDDDALAASVGRELAFELVPSLASVRFQAALVDL
jgi:hypothetical protein